jgi:hypothetical protein
LVFIVVTSHHTHTITSQQMANSLISKPLAEVNTTQIISLNSLTAAQVQIADLFESDFPTFTPRRLISPFKAYGDEALDFLA